MLIYLLIIYIMKLIFVDQTNSIQVACSNVKPWHSCQKRKRVVRRERLNKGLTCEMTRAPSGEAPLFQWGNRAAESTPSRTLSELVFIEIGGKEGAVVRCRL
jgi:hypothetical protein